MVIVCQRVHLQGEVVKRPPTCHVAAVENIPITNKRKFVHHVAMGLLRGEEPTVGPRNLIDHK